MIQGIGMDMVEIERIKEAVERNPRFISRVLTEREVKRFEALHGKRSYEYLAGRYAVKEAYGKANGTGLGKDISFQDLEVNQAPSGAPFLEVNSLAFNKRVHVSITHTDQFAAAYVIIEE
ncbi:holo-ACP synthase [Salsuginibacillus kocurii]|uniref:holo-ACP synthase n=1 Tax=Salsuginibacillus kocurii TaxID=427078 RepID=UPI00037A81D8|nr:holo-ACP synthase [Salsuginibacillus kocurii]